MTLPGLMKRMRPGEWVQIDSMLVSREGGTLKEFKATCPIGKQLVARVYSRATAHNARRFLEAVREDLPYPGSLTCYEPAQPVLATNRLVRFYNK